VEFKIDDLVKNHPKDGFDCRGVLRTPLTGRVPLAPKGQGAQKLRSEAHLQGARQRFTPLDILEDFPIQYQGSTGGSQERDCYLTGQG